ncbi:MAG: hypothetical protein OXR66_01695 [Candidatus Woesearchaeota archaeon]|nr:hypothetical protein [Candidatus Woesearchaeota archaeon]
MLPELAAAGAVGYLAGVLYDRKRPTITGVVQDAHIQAGAPSTVYVAVEGCGVQKVLELDTEGPSPLRFFSGPNYFWNAKKLEKELRKGAQLTATVHALHDEIPMRVHRIIRKGPPE